MDAIVALLPNLGAAWNGTCGTRGSALMACARIMRAVMDYIIYTGTFSKHVHLLLQRTFGAGRSNFVELYLELKSVLLGDVKQYIDVTPY